MLPAGPRRTAVGRSRAPTLPRVNPASTVVVMDTDSYVKWGADLASRLPAGTPVRLVLLRSYVEPSERQVAAALAGTAFSPADVERLDARALRRRLATDAPDVLVLAVRGHVVPHVVGLLPATGPRPVLVTGITGIALPVQQYDLDQRRAADLFVVHSHRELRELGTAAQAQGRDFTVALATLPFLHGRAAEPAGGDPDGDVVFATQALVPLEREQRRHLLRRLVEAARAQPARRVVVKTRSQQGEAETHRGGVPYDVLLAELRAHEDVPDNLVVSSASMREHLATARVLVTVSSTAVLEALAAGVPGLVLRDFGLDEAMMNDLFEGSGLVGDLDDVVAGRVGEPDPAWLADNYFHPETDDTWVAELERLRTERAAGRLPVPAAPDAGLAARLLGVYYRRDALAPWRGTALEPLERLALGAARRLWALRRR